MKQSLKGYLLMGTALVACPCHLPITLALLAGTGLGGFLSENLALVAVGMTGYFVIALIWGRRLLGPSKAGERAEFIGPTEEAFCDTCMPPGSVAEVGRTMGSGRR